VWKALGQKYHELDREGLKYDQFDYDSGRFWIPFVSDSERNSSGFWMYAGWNDTAWVNDPKTPGLEIADVWCYYKRKEEVGAVAFPNKAPTPSSKFATQ
jgi:hypothetical protein